MIHPDEEVQGLITRGEEEEKEEEDKYVYFQFINPFIFPPPPPPPPPPFSGFLIMNQNAVALLYERVMRRAIIIVRDHGIIMGGDIAMKRKDGG